MTRKAPDATVSGGSAAEQAVGGLLAAGFGAAARLRGGKPIHPRGVLARAVLERFGGLGQRWQVPWLDEPGGEPATVRFSRSVGLPSRLPDVLGLAIRFGPAESPHDVLLATTGLRPGLRHALLPRRHPLTVAYTTLLPYDAGGRWVLLAAVPEAGERRAVDDEHALAAALADRAAVFRLLVATPRSEWTPFGRLTVSRKADTGELDPQVAFDPALHPLPGLALAAPFRGIRESAYHAARRWGGERDETTGVRAGSGGHQEDRG